MISYLISYTRKIPIKMYFTGSILFFSIIGLIPLFGYIISVAQERMLNGVNTEPPNINELYSLTIKGIKGLLILFVTLLPSGIIYVLMPMLLDKFNVGGLSSIFLLILSLIGILFSFSGLYLFSVFLFAYSRYSVDERLNLTTTILYSIVQVSTTRKYFYSFLYITCISLLFGLLTEVFFTSVILAPFSGVLAVIYMSYLGYIIGSLTTEFRPVDNVKIDINNILKNQLNKFKSLFE